MLKYKDYYYGTGRLKFPVIKNIQDAFSIEPVRINNLELEAIQQKLLNSFPYDLWK